MPAPLIVSGLLHPVFQFQARHSLKLPYIIRHQDSAGGDGVPGNRRVVRANRRPCDAQRDLNLRGGIHRRAIPGQDGIEPLTERVNQLDMARRGLRACGVETHLGVGDGRDQYTVATQHHLLQALQYHFRLLAHDERADVRIEHIDLVHRLKFVPVDLPL